MHCVRLDCSDFCVHDCFPELLESVRDTEEGLSVAADVALPEVSPVVFAGAAAVPVSLPAVARVVSSDAFAGGVAADAAPLADEGTVTVGVSVLTDTGRELPAELLKAVRVTEDWLSVSVFAGAAAVPASLPTITGVSSAVFAGGGGGGVVADAAPLVDVGTVTF